MTNTIRNSALALALLGGVALASAPALADHRHDHGHGHNNAWNNAHNDWQGNNRFRHGYAYYGPRPYYGYGNYYNYGRPGFSIYIR
jgi:hypothetical protein